MKTTSERLQTSPADTVIVTNKRPAEVMSRQPGWNRGHTSHGSQKIHGLFYFNGKIPEEFLPAAVFFLQTEKENNL